MERGKFDMEFLTIEEARDRSRQIREALAEILNVRPLVQRPKSGQWRFLQAAMERLLAPEVESEFDALPAVRAAQLKFEIERKLNHFYRRYSQPPVRFVFGLLHRRDMPRHGVDPEEYPLLAGYGFMVRDISAEVQAFGTLEEERLYIERVVTEAADAEFRVYAALPDAEAKLADLAESHSTKGPAYREIVNVVRRLQARSWVISNPNNPSTKRVISVRVREIKRNEALVSTVEYWYLKWWDSKKLTYRYPYRETNRQSYVLRKEPDGWKIWQNLRPSPRTSVPYTRIAR